MTDDCIEIVAMADSSGESEEKYEIYKANSEMFCVVGLENNQQTPSKTTGTKPRYKQSYREAWESMRDFKGWLSNVPGNTSKAYCKLCQKELHCHRLSLLKHKVTFKHQKKEEEQKLSKLRGKELAQSKADVDTNKESARPPGDGFGSSFLYEGDKNDSNMKKIKDIQSENTEGSNSNSETVFEVERDGEGTEENIILSEATTSHSCKCLLQYNEEEAESKNGFLSTHVLDISKGLPGASVHVVLYKLISGRWTLVQEGVTNGEGRHQFLESNETKFSEGRYKLHYDVEEYFEKQSQETIFPFIEVVFDAKDMSKHYHIPLLLSPYGYSTYRGS